MSYSNPKSEIWHTYPTTVTGDGATTYGPTDAQLKSAGWLPDLDDPIGQGQMRGDQIVEADHVRWPVVDRPLAALAAMARDAAIASRNARIDAIAGDSRAQRRILMGAIGVLNRARKGRPRADDASKTAALEAAEAAIESIEAEHDAAIAAIDAAFAANDRAALLAVV